ncbi:hypothetical protein KR032_011764, partial [Drosophila birchii]
CDNAGFCIWIKINIFLQMDSRRSSIMTSDESTMYLSFDGDDKWQSALVTQSSQLLEMHASSKMEAGDDKDLRRAVLKDLHQLSISHDPDLNSPLRPFDKSVLNRHNALSSTPSKDTVPAVATPPQTTPLDLTSVDNKENSHPDGADNSTLSNSDLTANTVKANTLKTEDATIDEVAEQEVAKPSVSTVYPLSDNVVLENITEISNEEVSVMASPSVPKDIPPKETEEVNEVSELIAKILKMTTDTMEPSNVAKSKVETGKRQSMTTLYSAPLPRPRRSYLPTRMSVVVKTTLNSPARKRRISCLPVSRRSVSASGPSRKLDAATNTSGQKNAPMLSKPPTKSAPVIFTCKTCEATFRVKSLLTVHERIHNSVENGPRAVKRLPSASGTGASGSQNRCKYCDKNFALERALHIHLMEKCDKIPPGEKRKLKYTELNHVKKAQLPKISVSAPSTNPPKPQARMSTIPSKAFSNGTQLMPPPSARKVSKNVAHLGVYRTPTKSVPCHLCKQSFKSILEFTTHSLKVHGKGPMQKVAVANGEDDAPSAMD